MAKLLNKPDTKQTKGRWYILTSPLRVQIFNTVYELAAGYVCDGPSIPEFVPPAIIGKDDIFYPAIVHDASCALGVEPRIVSDAVFWDLSCQSSNARIATMAYIGVRIGQVIKYESVIPDEIPALAAEIFENPYDSDQLHADPQKYIKIVTPE